MIPSRVNNPRKKLVDPVPLVCNNNSSNNNSNLLWDRAWTPHLVVSFRAEMAVDLAPPLADRAAAIPRPPCGQLYRLYVERAHKLKPYRMGELEPWIDENFVRTLWFGMGYQVNVKMIRDKFSG